MPEQQTPLDLNEVFDPKGYATGRIGYHVDLMVRQKVIRESDREDIGQEMNMRLLKRLQRYDPSRAHLNTYIANCVRYDAGEITRQQFSEKSVTERGTASLDVSVGVVEGRAVSMGDSMTRSEQVRGRGKVDQDDEFAVDLYTDFQSVKRRDIACRACETDNRAHVG